MSYTPSILIGEVDVEELPTGWETCRSDDGAIYYYNRALEVSTTELPGRQVERFITAKPSSIRGSCETSDEDDDGALSRSSEDPRSMSIPRSAFTSEPNSPQNDVLRRRLVLSQARTASTKDIHYSSAKEEAPERMMVNSGSVSLPSSPEMMDRKKQRSKSSLTKILFKKKDKSESISSEKGDVDWERDRLIEGEEWVKSEEAIREKKWDAPPDRSTIDERSLSVLDIGCLTYGFNPEYGKNIQMDEPLTLEERAKHTNYFQTLFANNEHYNFVGDDDILGPIVLSIQSNTAIPASQKNFFGILRTKKGDERLIIPRLSTLDTPEACAKYLRTNTSSLQTVRFTRIVDPKSQQDLVSSLLSYERQLIQKNYKFGVLYVKDGQTEENQYFNNVEYSDGFRQFLNVIADEVDLKGFTGFAGGLDCKNNSTGLTSYHTTFENIQIMLHVSTLLPYFPKDLQQVERKRHLGNDVVIIIYKEGGSVAFDPRVVASQFNHVFAVVQPEGDQWRVCLANKFGVKPYAPILPEPCLFNRDSKFRDFLLTKLVNGERAAMYAPDFRGTLARTREVLLRSMVEKHYQPEQRSGLRRLSDAFKTQNMLSSQRKKSISSGNRLTISTDGS